MRRIVCILTAAVLTFSLIICASAVSYSDRARYYLYITSSDTAMFSLSSTTDENGNTSNVLTNIGTLPAGTPVSSGEVVEEGYRKVVYMDQSASTHTVVISSDVIRSNYVTLDFGGSVGSVRIPKPASANASFIKDYLNYRGISVSESDITAALEAHNSSSTPAPVSDGQVAEKNDSFPTGTPAPGESSASTTPKKSTKTAATPAPDRKAVEASDLVYLNDGGTMIPVTIAELGLARSTVIADGRELKVATASLVWETNASGNERLAVVYAPKSGKASLRKTSKSSSLILEKVTAGTIVRVFDIQSKMTGIYVGDKAGYMLNSALKLTEPYSTFTTGRLSYKGSLTNTHRINLYTQAKESSRKIKGVHAGDVITILSDNGSWTELDMSGFHGYVLSKYVTPDETPEPLSSLDDVPAASESENEDDLLIEEEVVGEEESGEE